MAGGGGGGRWLETSVSLPRFREVKMVRPMKTMEAKMVGTLMETIDAAWIQPESSGNGSGSGGGSGSGVVVQTTTTTTTTAAAAAAAAAAGTWTWAWTGTEIEQVESRTAGDGIRRGRPPAAYRRADGSNSSAWVEGDRDRDRDRDLDRDWDRGNGRLDDFHSNSSGRYRR